MFLKTGHGAQRSCLLLAAPACGTFLRRPLATLAGKRRKQKPSILISLILGIYRGPAQD